jgi:hypothetical protein
VTVSVLLGAVMTIPSRSSISSRAATDKSTLPYERRVFMFHAQLATFAVTTSELLSIDRILQPETTPPSRT